METGKQCYICKKAIAYGEATCEMDVNIAACAAGAGNWQTCHSQCLRGSIIWDTQPRLIGCACRFNKVDEFTAATLVEPCGFHSKMRREIDDATKLSQEIHDYLKKRPDEKHGLIGNLRCIYDHVLRDIKVPT